nr:Coenzyme F420 hydrogenase/dehydrogenase, beta subunit C-terminal domain [uncultured Catonella sp.]
MIINYTMDECSACEACKVICPTSAITMTENEKGFAYPYIDDSLCIECGRCEAVCPLNDKNINKLSPKIYAFRKRDSIKLADSQSGGAFSAFAEIILKSGGTVYGVALEEFIPKYMRVDKPEDLGKLKGSKYVEAITGDIFLEVNKDLKAGKQVLFSGSPCHTEGLHHFIKNNKNRDNLITCDLICHGVPGRLPYFTYLEYLFRNRGKVSEFNFRDKSLGGWHEHAESFVIRGNKEFSRDYTNLFYLNTALRDSCYKCRYACEKRASDITIGDFWGVERNYPEKDDNKGLSVVMLRSVKAEKIFEEIIKEDEAWKLTLEECIQPNLKHPTPKPELTDNFWEDIKVHDFDYILRNYSDVRYGLNIKREIVMGWSKLNDRGYVVTDYFKERGLLNIALAGDKESIIRVLSEIRGKMEMGEDTANAVSILDVYGLQDENDESFLGLPVINERNITDEALAPIDCVLVTDEVNSSDIMTRLTGFGIGMEYVYPLSFILSEEE